MKVGHVTERSSDGGQAGQGNQLDADEVDRAGFDLGATGRLQLMAKLAEGESLNMKKFQNRCLLKRMHYQTLYG